MTKLVEQMKRAALEVYEAIKPVNVMYGRVTSANPLRVQLSQKLNLTKDFFIVREGENSFSVGDVLILIRMQGGQQYLIFGKKGAL